MIVTYAHRYKRPPRKRKPQPPLPTRIITAKTPKPTKRRRLGFIVSVDRSDDATGPKPAIISGTRGFRRRKSINRRGRSLRGSGDGTRCGSGWGWSWSRRPARFPQEGELRSGTFISPRGISPVGLLPGQMARTTAV
jgi:hypothetical protein